MGFLSRLLGRGNDSKSESAKNSQSTPDIVVEDSLDSAFIQGEFRGDRVTFSSESSPNGQWKCLYGRSTTGGDTPIVLVDTDDKVRHAFAVVQAQNVVVANTGHVVVPDVGDADDQSLAGVLNVVAPDGQPCIEYEVDANIWNCALTDDGRYASTATHNPDRTVYIFDVESGDIVTTFETPDLNAPPQEFGQRKGEVVLYLLDGDGRYRGIDLDGNTVWRSEELERQERVDELLAKGKEADPAESIEFLQEAYELADGQYEARPIANKLADTHWNLSKSIRKEEGDTDDWWFHLNQAKQYYYEVVSWYDGRKGVAKVARKQAKYHLKEDEEEAALQLLQSISALEEEHDVQLLTDADKRKIERLS